MNCALGALSSNQHCAISELSRVNFVGIDCVCGKVQIYSEIQEHTEIQQRNLEIVAGLREPWEVAKFVLAGVLYVLWKIEMCAVCKLVGVLR